MSEQVVLHVRAGFMTALALLLLLAAYQEFCPLQFWGIGDVWDLPLSIPDGESGVRLLTSAVIVYTVALTVLLTALSVLGGLAVGLAQAVTSLAIPVVAIACFVMAIVIGLEPGPGLWFGMWAAPWSMGVAALAALFAVRFAQTLVEECRRG